MRKLGKRTIENGMKNPPGSPIGMGPNAAGGSDTEPNGAPTAAQGKTAFPGMPLPQGSVVHEPKQYRLNRANAKPLPAEQYMHPWQLQFEKNTKGK